ncbi:MAG: glutamate racemase [Coriobacteriales bacterium]|jgi:glutamate racemase|nr:glutamate racemase [Coriobacteriales bacterium]
MQNQASRKTASASRPIGVFDSGIGGLTVVRAIARRLPRESVLYFGDTLRCPYGPRPLEEIRSFARQISSWLAQRDVKLIVIACNSATAAALGHIQQELPVPVIGVIEPGARAAVQATRSGRVGVIGTAATIDSGAYTLAIRGLDAGITTFSVATPRFVEIVEQGLSFGLNPRSDLMEQASAIYLRPEFLKIARDYLAPLKRCKIDTLVLGCTHYPLLTPLISQVVGPDVRIISSAEETAHEVGETLGRRGQLASVPKGQGLLFATTAPSVKDFAVPGRAILARTVAKVQLVGIPELEDALARFEADGGEAGIDTGADSKAGIDTGAGPKVGIDIGAGPDAGALSSDTIPQTALGTGL